MKKEDITALVQFTLEQYGRVDVMVNNAIIDNAGVPLRSYLSMCELIKAIAKGRPVSGPHEPLAIEERLGPIERMWSPYLDLGD